MVQTPDFNTSGRLTYCKNASLNLQLSNIGIIEKNGPEHPIPVANTIPPFPSESQGPPAFPEESVPNKRKREDEKDHYIYEGRKRRLQYDKYYASVQQTFQSMYKRCGAWIVLYCRR
jgi:hypothetical protein